MISQYQCTNQNLCMPPSQFDNDTSTVPHQVYIITIFHLWNTLFRAFLFLFFPYEAFVLNHPSVSLPFSFIVCTCDLFVSNVFFPCLESCFAVVFQRRIKFINILLSKTLHTYFWNEVLNQYLITFRFLCSVYFEVVIFNDFEPNFCTLKPCYQQYDDRLK